MSKRSTGPNIFLAVFTFLIALAAAFYVWLTRRVALSVIKPEEVTEPDAFLMDLDRESKTITLSNSPVLSVPGRYGLSFGRQKQGYLKIGDIVRQDSRSITRQLIELSRGTPVVGDPVWQMSWFYAHPADLTTDYREILIKGSAGILPAWLFPLKGSSQWAILVHGRGADRAECLRAVPLLLEQGYQCLIVSYRNDGVATPTHSQRYGLGGTEWRDIAAAAEFARVQGAEQILMVAWSMGAAITQEYLRRVRGTSEEVYLSGVIYDSPVVDWKTVLDYHADLAGLASPIRGGAEALLSKPWGTMLTGAEHPIDFAALSLLEHPEDVYLPTLILHSDDDQYVPSSGSRELQALQPELVTLVSFDDAQHVRLWNYDAARWQGAIKTWLQYLRSTSS